jgi:intracellular sulfur oxidation DsrE/DsrF family protein
MKSLRLSLAITLLLSPLLSFSQQNSEVIDMKKHKIIIQFADSDSVAQVRLTQQVGNLRACWPNAEVEVVCLGPGLDLLMTAKSKAGEGVATLSGKGIVFAACNNTMKMRKVNKEDLLKQAVVVPAAIVELAAKQEEGWSYFQSGK